MAEIDKLIEMLRSPSAGARVQACELLRITASLTPLAMEALQEATHDPDTNVADSAKNCLRVHLAAAPSSPQVGAQSSASSDQRLRRPRAIDYTIAALVGAAVPHCLWVSLFTTGGIFAPWEWFSTLPYLLRPGPFQYGDFSVGLVLVDWLALVSPILAGLLFCRLWGRKAGIVASVALGLVCFGWFFIVLYIAGG